MDPKNYEVKSFTQQMRNQTARELNFVIGSFPDSSIGKESICDAEYIWASLVAQW